MRAGEKIVCWPLDWFSECRDLYIEPKYLEHSMDLYELLVTCIHHVILFRRISESRILVFDTET